MIELPICGERTGCGERMHPSSHPKHVVEELRKAGYDLGVKDEGGEA